MKQADNSRMIRFEKLLAQKKRYILTLTVFFLSFYFALPFLTSFFPELMNIRVCGNISFAWILAFAQFFMTWVIAMLYLRKARSFDVIVQEIRKNKQIGKRKG